MPSILLKRRPRKKVVQKVVQRAVKKVVQRAVKKVVQRKDWLMPAA